MKHLIIFLVPAAMLFACTPAKVTNVSESASNALTTDSVEYYITEFATDQRNYLHLLTGTWTINSMQRQQKLDAETLEGFSIELRNDKTYTIKTVCGNINGRFILKGTSIRFLNVSDDANCLANEQALFFGKLIADRVSAYSVDNSTLLLRDGSSNVVFRASR